MCKILPMSTILLIVCLHQQELYEIIARFQLQAVNTCRSVETATTAQQVASATWDVTTTSPGEVTAAPNEEIAPTLERKITPAGIHCTESIWIVINTSKIFTMFGSTTHVRCSPTVQPIKAQTFLYCSLYVIMWLCFKWLHPLLWHSAFENKIKPRKSQFCDTYTAQWQSTSQKTITKLNMLLP